MTASSLFAPILSADPSFRPVWDAFEAEWRSENDPPHYLALGSLADHLIQQLRAGETSRSSAIFAVVEAWRKEGDAYVADAASSGLLEGIQTSLGGQDRGFRSESGVRESDFERWLGPASRQSWDEPYRFWDGGSVSDRPEQ